MCPFLAWRKAQKPCERAEVCTSLVVWKRIQAAVNDIVDGITLANLRVMKIEKLEEALP